MTKTFKELIPYLQGLDSFEFGVYVIRICFGFRISSFGF